MANLITLAEICKELKIDPKAARVILRKHDDTPEPAGEGTRWEWTRINALKVKNILKA